MDSTNDTMDATEHDNFGVTDNTELPEVDELDALKARADQLGIKYHPSIGVDKLREKVNTYLASSSTDPKSVDEPQTTSSPKAALPAQEETPQQRARRIKEDALRLVRIRVSCMNPAKKEWEGEIFTVSNAVIGTVRKYVPFNADDGWHVPNIIYKMMRDRECQIFFDQKDGRGNTIRKGKQIREFAIEILPALNAQELKDLAQRQAMAKSID